MLDYLGIFREFNKKKIKYIVVGGLAVNLYGIPRMTYDIDLLLKMGDENLKKFVVLLKKWGFRPKPPVDFMDFCKKGKREIWIKEKNMRAFNLYNPSWALSEIDIIINTPVNYEQAKKNIKYVKLSNVKIPLIGIEDLIKMKKKSCRKQDKIDCRYLKKILDYEGRI